MSQSIVIGKTGDADFFMTDGTPTAFMGQSVGGDHVIVTGTVTDPASNAGPWQVIMLYVMAGDLRALVGTLTADDLSAKNLFTLPPGAIPFKVLICDASGQGSSETESPAALGASVTEAEITLADNTTNNATSTKHGFVPKTPNNAAHFLNGANPAAFAAVTKSNVGLGNVDNTADTAKPVSTAQQTALDLKQNLITPGANIPDPTGAETDQDDEARAAIALILDLLEAKNLMAGA